MARSGSDRSGFAWAALAVVVATGSPVRAQAGPEPAWDFVRTTSEYRLVGGSSVSEECATCPIVASAAPVRGEMRVQPGGDCMDCPLLLGVELTFRTSEGARPAISGSGRGTLRLFGPDADDAFTGQRMRLNVSIVRGGEPPRTTVLDSGIVRRTAPSPWIDIVLRGELELAAGGPVRVALDLVAAPWPRVLVSTASSMTSATLGRRVGDGDLLDPDGRVEATMGELVANLGLELDPRDPDGPGLDGADILVDPLPPDVPVGLVPSEETLFSLSRDAVGEQLGPLSGGDVLGSRGRVVLRQSDWVRAFSSRADVAPGLDALALLGDGSFLISVAEELFSDTLGRRIRDGDLLRTDGSIFRSEAELYAGFGVLDAAGAGLDAVFVWPHGEIWFSPERDFESSRLGRIGHGDLLSDVGRVVLRNREIVEAFSPLEDLADFGLDALAIDASAHFSDCGFLVEDAGCAILEADCGGRYVVRDLQGFAAGDRVRVTGRLVGSCAAPCPPSDGCILAAILEECGFDGCGLLVEGPGACLVFQTDAGRRFLLDDVGPFVAGDRVQVSGKVRTGCNSACVTPCAAIVGSSIGPCAFEDCGRLVDLGDGCVVFETADGDRYAIETAAGFAPGDSVFVAGALVEDPARCGSPCAGRDGVVGCIEDPEMDATGPIGEVGFFRRADCNADGNHDLADAVYGLMSLFSGGPDPSCPDACNSNGDGEINITDPIYTLSFLFQGGLSPPPPFPSCVETKLRIDCGGSPCPCDYPETSCR